MIIKTKTYIEDWRNEVKEFRENLCKINDSELLAILKAHQRGIYADAPQSYGYAEYWFYVENELKRRGLLNEGSTWQERVIDALRTPSKE